MPELAAPTALRFEHLPADQPVLGIGTPAPRISWQIPAAPDDYARGTWGPDAAATLPGPRGWVELPPPGA